MKCKKIESSQIKRGSEEIVRKIRRVGRSELEKVRSRERKEEKDGERGRRRS